MNTLNTSTTGILKVVGMFYIKNKALLIFFAIFALGFFARVWRFGALPGGLNQDEAFAAYNSWALLTFGLDSSLRTWPVYLIAWGSGMNALESYLMLPFVALFGAKIWAIRLPQLLVALTSIWVAYRLGQRMDGERTGLLFALLLAICPWHIMLSRWGLESNLAPGFLLFGLYFFLRGLEEGRFLQLSALCYGLSLYAYAAIWPVMPLLLGLLLLYSRPKIDRYLLIAGLIFAALALPLVGFLAVNYELCPEFSIGPISVPQLVQIRASDISFSNIPEKFRNLLHLLLSRKDGLSWNSPERFGLFYPCSLPFALLGFGELLYRLARSLRQHRFDPAVLLLIWLFVGCCLGCVIHINNSANRINILLLPLVLCTAFGIESLLRLGCLGKAARIGIPVIYLLFFALFAQYYFDAYNNNARVRRDFTFGIQSAVSAALAHEGTIYVTDAIHYPKLLLLTGISPQHFNETVEYINYPAMFLQVRRFGRFIFCKNDITPEDLDGIYLLDADTPTTPWEERGFTVERHDCFVLLYRK